MQLITKTIKLRLYIDNDQIEQIRSMCEQYRLACNYVSEYIFNNGFELNSNKLNKVLYSSTRSIFGLKAQMTQSVFRTVTAKYKTVNTELYRNPYKYKDDNGKWNYIIKTLEWLSKPIIFNKPQADLIYGRDYSFTNNTKISMCTLDKRIKVNYSRQHFENYFDNNWTFGTAKIIENKKKWYLHIPVSKYVEEFQKENVQHVVGIDRGLRFITVSYDEQGRTHFISGKDIARKRHKYVELRKQLQSKGTKSAKRVLKRLSKRENSWMIDVNHQISKALVQHYGPNTLFVLEDLTGVSFPERNLNNRAEQNYELRSWTFYQLEEFLNYKAHENCSEVLKVSAKYTSQRCPKCGIISKEQRHHDTHEYICQCGYKSNDDRIGAMNIQLLGTQWISGTDKPSFSKITVSE